MYGVVRFWRVERELGEGTGRRRSSWEEFVSFDEDGRKVGGGKARCELMSGYLSWRKAASWSVVVHGRGIGPCACW